MKLLTKAFCLATVLSVLLLSVMTTFFVSAAGESVEGGATSSPSVNSNPNAYKGGPIPTLNGLTQKQEAYQLQVWAFIVVLVIGLLGFGTMASIDYSDDALLTSAPDNKLE